MFHHNTPIDVQLQSVVDYDGCAQLSLTSLTFNTMKRTFERKERKKCTKLFHIRIFDKSNSIYSEIQFAIKYSSSQANQLILLITF